MRAEITINLFKPYNVFNYSEYVIMCLHIKYYNIILFWENNSAIKDRLQ